ncbi:helix-turn-helix transcriptional regulator [Alkalihalobacillus sp. LMS6]|uniref:helix-turn-helix domain-containing protein n=1 Tax=Alkalihalobacillus sp. LMS6 TaxID=2924034 RepID=UPI0020D0A785|nr:helix-turn-helix transcriptional regulator [Alkalihalobacillus sp. LMS6]UTR05127.1 helix-turn-helix transcriptional regulator [Alkalihalobacillus sp. LMS6]
MGLGKKRSKFGKWLDDRGISQQWVADKSGVGRTTISKLASDDNYDASFTTVRKILGAIKTIDERADVHDLFNI